MQAAEDDVDGHAGRDQPGGGVDVYAGHGGDDDAAAEQQLAGDENVGGQGEADEDKVRGGAVADVDNLEKGVAL